MSKRLLTVSLAPHIFDDNSVSKIMLSVVAALFPAMIASVYFFGLGSISVVVIAISSAVIFEYLLQKFVLKVKPSIQDGSAIVTGMLLAFNLPSHLPWWMTVLGSFAAIAIAKMSFGGLGKNPFNPALIGRVFLLVSFPAAMTSWPKPLVDRMSFVDGITTATPLGIVKEAVKSGVNLSEITTHLPSYWDLFLGHRGGCLGETSIVALLIGAIFLLRRKIITWHIPGSMVGTIFIFSTILWLINPERYPDPLFQILTGGIILGALFMATDYVTSPMTQKGMIIFGGAIGILTVVIRTFGSYPEGVSFAILIMNGFVPLINRYCKPRRFGER